MVTHSKVTMINDRPQKKSWIVDVDYIKRNITGYHWLSDDDLPNLLENDLREMSRFFPNWFLVAGNSSGVAVCRQCREYIVPFDGAWCCVACDYVRRSKVEQLVWTGLLPRVIQEPKVKRNLEEMQHRGQLRVGYNNGTLYVPIRIHYPQNWPHINPDCYYEGGGAFFRAVGIRGDYFGHSYHMLSQNKMCLYGGHSRFRSIKDVIQNKVLYHLHQIVRIASGAGKGQNFM